jgi:hypothetical protein
MQPELAELLEQQQRDRRQLLLYSARLDDYVRKIVDLNSRISELTEEIKAAKAGNRLALEEIQSRYAAEIGELAAWRETMMRSRVYRLMLLYGRLYQVPVLGRPLRFLRRAAGGVYAGLQSFRQR